MNLLKITLGDWANDGHGRTASYIFEVNKTKEQIQSACKKTEGKTMVSFDLGKRCTLFSDYEDSNMSINIKNVLVDAGVPSEFFDEVYMYDDETYSFDDETATLLYLYMAKASLPDLEWKLIEIPEIRGIGYGLFY